MNYLDLCIEKGHSLRAAMERLNQTGKKIIFVIDGPTLVGALTDGDIRRYLLSQGKLEDAVELVANRTPIVAESRKSAKAIMRDTGAIAVPVLGKGGNLIDIVLNGDQNIFRPEQLGLPVVIMAGGKGTRLDPYTRILPKPLIPIGDKPVIEHIMQRFSDFGCEDFHIVVNYKKQLIKAYFAENEQQWKTHWYDEEKPLGTGGGLSLLKGRLHQTFFFTNCDILLLADYAAMLKFHRQSGNAVTMVCACKNVTIPYGVVDIGEGGVIEHMREKPEFSFLTNTGMYLVEPEVLEDIQNDVSIGFPDIIEQQRLKGRKVAVFPVGEDAWLDMGQIEEMEKMRERLYGE